MTTDKRIHDLTTALLVADSALEAIEKAAQVDATTGVEAGRLLERCLISAMSAREQIEDQVPREGSAAWRLHTLGRARDDMMGTGSEDSETENDHE